jgi:hypothetical protein
MKKLWANASPSQKDTVEHYKEEDEETDEDPDNETGDSGGVQCKQVKRLQEVMRYMITWNSVTFSLNSVTFSLNSVTFSPSVATQFCNTA